MQAIKKVAVFHPTSYVGSAWCCSEGILHALNKLGYEVINCGHISNSTVTLEALKKVDLIILSAVEWYAKILMDRFGDAWYTITTPKLAWVAESAYRDDQNFPFKDLQPIADAWYYPAAQDAMEFKGGWLPFGVDTDIFKPQEIAKSHNVAFLGSMYQKRVDYLQKIDYPITHIKSVSDPDPARSFALLAEAYNSTKIFLNLPALSRLLVTKVTEVMACKTMLVTPALDHPTAQQNMLPFENGKHLIYYNPNSPGELKSIFEHYLHHPEEAEKIAYSGWEEVTQRHALTQRIEQMIKDASSLLARKHMVNCLPLAQAIEIADMPSPLNPLPLSIYQGKYGHFLINSHDGYIGKSIAHYGGWSDEEVELFLNLCEAGDHVIEVGSNIGTHTIPLAKKVGPNGRITAFEPQRIIYQNLCANISINGLTNIDAHMSAVSSESGLAWLPEVDYSADGNFGGIRVSEVQLTSEVSKVSLDALPPFKSLKLLKVDAEDMELKVIQGAENLIKTHRPFLYLENNPQNPTELALVQKVRDLGYTVYSHTTNLFDTNNYFKNKENIFGETRSYNILCIPNENTRAINLESFSLSLITES